MSVVILDCMNSNSKVLDDVAHLVLINRVFTAHNLSADVTFATRLNQNDGGKHPSKRDVKENCHMVVPVAVTEMVLGWSRATKSLAMMVLIFM